jgi:methylated-DNA-[protein]-cysteine S-methyltransferase
MFIKTGGALCSRVFKTRLGWCGVVGGVKGIVSLVLPARSRSSAERAVAQRVGRTERREIPLLRKAERQVKEYFEGERRAFDLPLCIRDRRAFERSVYRVTKGIPYGRTVTYGWIASKVGRPGAARAVGRVMAGNPIPLMIPCHRVLASDGGLCGFSAEGGLGLKRALLALETRPRPQGRSAGTRRR